MCYRGNHPKRRNEKAAGGWSAAFLNGKTGKETCLLRSYPDQYFFCSEPDRSAD